MSQGRAKLLASFLKIGAFLSVGAVRLREAGNTTSTPVQPHLVEPGEWLVDKTSKFLFLPLAVPEKVGHARCKIMANGDSLLVVVTERAEEKPETAALRKYKMVVQAFKDEGILRHDESLVKTKLEEWLDTEDDDEVRQYILEALTSLNNVRAAKQNITPREVSLRLSLLSQNSAPHTTLSQERSDSKSLRLRRSGIVRESFAIDIPYPVPVGKVFVLNSSPTMLLVGMPLLSNSLEANGVSTGGKPFLRLPVFGHHGEHLVEAGVDKTSHELEQLVAKANIIVPSAQLAGLKPLSSL